MAKKTELVEWSEMGLREKLYAIKMWGELAPTCKYNPNRDEIVEKYGIAFHVKQEGAQTHKELLQRGWTEAELQKLINPNLALRN